MQRWTGVSDVDETSEGTEGAASHQRDEQECEGCSFSMSLQSSIQSFQTASMETSYRV